MAIDFPPSPSLNDVYTFNGKSWTWNGYAWVALSFQLTVVSDINGITGSVSLTGSGIGVSVTGSSIVLSIEDVNGGSY